MPILSREEAFEIRSDEKRYPLIKQPGLQFTRRWFQYRNCTTFSTFLYERFAGKPTNLIQIGVFEAMDLVWQFQHVLTHPKSRAVAIDPWLGTRKLDQDVMDGVYQRAVNNLSKWKDQVQIVRATSQEALPKMLDDYPFGINPGEWDIVIIDGDHHAEPVYSDAVNSLPLVRKGGWLLFDDVRNRISKPDHVIHGLQRFLDDHGTSVEWAWGHRFCECYEKV